MPSYAIISDVHANLEALHSVLQEIEKENVDAIFFLGDSVGYGPDPNECIEILRDRTEIFLAGNHDRGAVGLTDVSYFNPMARAAINWTKNILTESNKDFLKELLLTATVKNEDLLLVHASPLEPEKWHYITNEFNAFAAFLNFDEKICLVGHSHKPFLAGRSKGGSIISQYNRIDIHEGQRYVVNVGSVGQPRDNNPDAAYAILRDTSITIKRISYDIVITQKKMKKAGLPDYLINRLAVGR